MQIHSLASGSTGNALLVQMGDTKILVDAGISNRRIETSLAQIGVNIRDLNGILLTHEHSDHIKGLDVLVRKHNIPVYTRPKTWEKIKCRNNLPLHCIHEINNDLTIGEVDVEAFNISHDASDPIGFCFYYENLKGVVVTDLGEVTKTAQKAMSNADMIVLESNHDPYMLSSGSYPHFLKQRIISEFGHLSNFDAAKALISTQLKTVTKIMLAHLSQENNMPSLALKTVSDILTEKGCQVGKDIILFHARPNSIASII